MTDIAGERAALAAQGLQIRYRGQWGAAFDYTNDRPCDVPATRIFLHIAVVDDPGDLLGTEDQVMRNIERIGINRFPAVGCSYNAAIFNTGRLYEGQPLTRRGAHTVNDFGITKCAPHGHPVTAPGTPMNLNVNARGIALPQECADPVTDAQVHGAAKWAAAQKRSGYIARDALWCGHRCVAAKACPCDNGFARIPEIETLTEHYTVNGVDDMAVTDAEQNAIAQKTAELVVPGVWNALLEGSGWGPVPARQFVVDTRIGVSQAIEATDAVLAALDVDALAAAIVALLPSPTELTQAEIQAATEAGVRAVLGWSVNHPAA